MLRSYEKLYTPQTAAMEHSFIRQILKVTRGVPGMISFAGGLPDPASFPKETLARLFHEVISETGDDVLQYGASEGDVKLKEALKNFEEVPWLPDDQLMITIGSTNGIYYYLRTLISPDDIIVCESPGFPGSIAAMQACGARMIGVEMDELGMRPDRLDETLRDLTRSSAPVKFLYLIPEFQNPSGRSMDLARRREILRTALRYDIPVLEDQPYRELRYSGVRIPTLWELARVEFGDDELVTIVKSFSKILGPGLRLGFAAGPEKIIEPMVKWAQKSTVSPDCITQRVTARFIGEGLMHPHIERIIELYRPKRDAMLETLSLLMPPGISWTEPEGGMFIWLTLPEEINTDRMFDLAIGEKVAFIPGSQFYPAGKKRYNEIRLNFSYPGIAEIREGIERLSALVRREIS
ncbi:MAG: PLP-dependent aminotransferase family protein [Spirochaetales bacterium]|nr:PLP-dependent aminotransferase family protein [Spirochaetales bacterium]